MDRPKHERAKAVPAPAPSLLGDVHGGTGEGPAPSRALARESRWRTWCKRMWWQWFHMQTFGDLWELIHTIPSPLSKIVPQSCRISSTSVMKVVLRHRRLSPANTLTPKHHDCNIKRNLKISHYSLHFKTFSKEVSWEVLTGKGIRWGKIENHDTIIIVNYFLENNFFVFQGNGQGF